MVDHQNDVTLPRAIACPHDMLTARQMLVRQHGDPPGLKGLLIADLAGFQAAAQAAPVTDALDVYNL